MPIRSRSAAMAAIMIALTGCANNGQPGSSSLVDQVGQSVSDLTHRVATAAQGSGSSLAAQNSGPTIDSTPLYRIFANNQFDTTKKFATQFPRVALRILTVPPNHNTNWQLVASASGCWTVSATLWRSRTASEAVPPFSVCVPRDMPQHIILGAVMDWEGQAGFFGVTDETTGNKRTDGPVPPTKPIPSDPAHQNFFRGPLMPDSLDAAMFGAVLSKMSFDWSVSQDRRVWIVRFDPALTQ